MRLINADDLKSMIINYFNDGLIPREAVIRSIDNTPTEYDVAQLSMDNAKKYHSKIELDDIDDHPISNETDNDTIKIDILGTPYIIKKLKYDEDISFKARGLQGYCDDYNKIIVYCDLDSVRSWDIEDENTKTNCEKSILRHEIVHAFLSESGLNTNSHSTESWARDEEVVEWITIQGPKIYKAWEDADAL